MFFSDYQVGNFVYLRYNFGRNGPTSRGYGQAYIFKNKNGYKVSAKKHEKILKARDPIRILIGGGF